MRLTNLVIKVIVHTLFQNVIIFQFIFQLGMKECEDLVLEFVKKWTPPRKCPLGGNSIGQVRLNFMVSYLSPRPSIQATIIVSILILSRLCYIFFAYSVYTLSTCYIVNDPEFEC